MPDDVTTIPSELTIPTCDTSLIRFGLYDGFYNQNITYEYDKVGNVLEMTDWACTITNAYDALNRKITEYTDNQNLDYAFYYDYDLLNNRTNMELIASDDGLTNSYSYDNLNRLSSLECKSFKTVSTTFAYNPNGKISGITNAASIYRDFSYDSEQRLSGISADYSGSTRLGLSYTYNHAQQITEIDETLYGTPHTYEYDYDNRDQLESEDCESILTSYAYDNAQNRVSKDPDNDPTETYSYVIANKLTNILIGSSSANNQYFYDIAGNLTSNVTNGKINKYYYNAQNKLVEIFITDLILGPAFNSTILFKYDSLNRRIAIVKVPGTSVLRNWQYTIHDGSIPIGRTDSSGNITKIFVRGIGIAEGTGDVLAEIDSSGNAHYYLPNHRGDTLLVLDEDGDIESQIRYDAFGNVKEETGTFSPTYTFSTKEYMSKGYMFNAKLYLYAYRVYDPIAGRWTQRDPIDYQDSINLYQFCGNNPVNGWDPFGLETRTHPLLEENPDDYEGFPEAQDTLREIQDGVIDEHNDSCDELNKKLKVIKAIPDIVKKAYDASVDFLIDTFTDSLKTEKKEPQKQEESNEEESKKNKND
ncbi:MAG: hypothetical protein DRI84_06715 [Bacteroidetes bacterium]|nr:MAG: hypothetical protein DRI84_06715 [Bacteroidota bacterium]